MNENSNAIPDRVKSSNARLRKIGDDLKQHLLNQRVSINSQNNHGSEEHNDIVTELLGNARTTRQELPPIMGSHPPSESPTISHNTHFSSDTNMRNSNSNNVGQKSMPVIFNQVNTSQLLPNTKHSSSGGGVTSTPPHNSQIVSVSQKKDNSSWNFGRLFRKNSNNLSAMNVQGQEIRRLKTRGSGDRQKDESRLSGAQSLQHMSIRYRVGGRIANVVTCSDTGGEYRDSTPQRYLQMLKEKERMRNQQIIVFLLSYTANFLVLFGFSIEYVIAVYYNSKEPATGQAVGLDYQDLQSTLLLTSLFFFFLAGVLEYIKRTGVLISIMIFLIGILKVSWGILDLTVNAGSDGTKYTFQQSQFIHMLVTLRLAIQVIFITGMFKWFSRAYLPLLIGFWFTNEYIAVKAGQLLQSSEEINILVSGVLLVIISIAFYYLYVFDPIDFGIIIHEQAIALTSMHSINREEGMEDLIRVDDFILAVYQTQLKQSLSKTPQNNLQTMIPMKRSLLSRTGYFDESGQKKKVDGDNTERSDISIEPVAQSSGEELNAIDVDIEDRDRLLNRWKTRSFTKISSYDSVINIILGSCLIFFKFRAISKSVAIGNYKERYNGVIGCYITFSEVAQIFLGYLILRYLRGRRNTINYILLIVLVLIELIMFASSLLSLEVTWNVMMLQGQLVFTLYYVVCILGPLELAKTTLLRNNIKLGGYLLCLMSGIQCLSQATLFDNLIFMLVPRSLSQTDKLSTILLNGFHLAATILAMLSMTSVLKRELQELKAIKTAQRQQQQ